MRLKRLTIIFPSDAVSAAGSIIIIFFCRVCVCVCCYPLFPEQVTPPFLHFSTESKRRDTAS